MLFFTLFASLTKQDDRKNNLDKPTYLILSAFILVTLIAPRKVDNNTEKDHNKNDLEKPTNLPNLICSYLLLVTFISPRKIDNNTKQDGRKNTLDKPTYIPNLSNFDLTWEDLPQD